MGKADTTSSNETVTVACKLPNGLRLRLHRMESTHEPVMGGGTRESKIARQVGEVFVVAGNSRHQDRAHRAQIVDGADNGYALTPGIPKAFWEEWLDQNKDHMAVRNGLIFAHTSSQSVQAEAREKSKVRSGLERLDPESLPRIGRKIETDDKFMPKEPR